MDLIKGWAKRDPSMHNWRQGMGTLYGGGPAFWTDDMSVSIPGRKFPVGAAPTPPVVMDMVAEMEGLMKKVFGDGN